MEKSGNSLVEPLHAPARDYGSTPERNEWAAYKGHIRGLLRGLVIGGVLGGLIALGALPIVGLVAGTTLTLSMVGTVCAGFAGMGALTGSHILGKIGTWAGSQASSFAERELEHRYENVRQDGSPDAPIPGFGHQFPVSGNNKKPIFWRVSLAAALLAGSAGLLIGVGAVPLLAKMHLMAPALALVAESSPLISFIPAIAGSMYGFSFGINRAYFRKLFNHTDAILDGKPAGPGRDDLARSQQTALAQNEGKAPPVITSRQREIIQHHLLDEYYDKAFWGGVHGNLRGFGHWMTAGTLTGIAFGAITIGVLAATGIVTALPALLAIGGVVAALGLAAGMHYAEAGMASGVDTAAEAHYEKRRQLLIDGKNPSLAAEKEPERGWFNWRVAVPTTIIGAAFGAVAAPVFSHSLVGLFGPVLGASHAAVVPTAATFGLIGTTLGLSPSTFKGLSKVADGIFNGAYYPGYEKKYQEEIVQKRVPLLSPDSYFKRIGEGCMVAGEIKAAEAQAARAPDCGVACEREAGQTKSAVERYAPDRTAQAFADRARLTGLQDRTVAV